MELKTYPDRELMFLSLADQIAAQLGDFLRRTGAASLCVPGGSTPGPVFDTLSGVDLDWANVAVFLNDERWVPESSDRSNTRLLRERLIRGKAAAAELVPLYLPESPPEDAMATLESGLRPHLPISVLLLGMGNDMHTASLFPNAPGLEALLASDAPPVMAAAGGAEPRITLTAPALQSALNIHIMIKGAQKRAALEAAMGADPVSAPISAFLRNAVVHYAE